MQPQDPADNQLPQPSYPTQDPYPSPPEPPANQPPDPGVAYSQPSAEPMNYPAPDPQPSNPAPYTLPTEPAAAEYQAPVPASLQQPGSAPSSVQPDLSYPTEFTAQELAAAYPSQPSTPTPAAATETAVPVAVAEPVPSPLSPMPEAQPLPQPTPPLPEPDGKRKKRQPKPFQNPLEAMRPGERMVIDVKRHPIGILGTYVGVSILIVVLAVLGYVVAPDILTTYSSSQVYGITTAILLCVVVLSGLFVLVAHIVYWGNHWIVTSDSITQVTQSSLFGKQSSQLSMANLEDITVEQNGILPHLFDYGLLWAETAGERDKFRFPYCPHPNDVAKQILQERETFMQGPGAQSEGPRPVQQYSPPNGVNQNAA